MVSELLAEICGIHAGDGWISSYNNEVGYGTSIKERQYFYEVMRLYKKAFDFPTARVLERPGRNNTLEFRIQSKALQKNFIVLGFPRGRKNSTLCVPEFVRKKKSLMKCFLRGLADTDGCVHWRKSGRKTYLTISWTVTSQNFAQEIADLLLQLDYKPTTYSFQGKGNRKTAWRVQLQNIENTSRYIKTIGFRNSARLKHKHE